MDAFVTKYVRFLWVVLAYAGLSGVLQVGKTPLNILTVSIFVVSVLNVISAYGLYRRLKWGWRASFFTGVAGLVLTLLFLALPGMILYLLVIYLSWRYRELLGGKKTDPLFPRQGHVS